MSSLRKSIDAYCKGCAYDSEDKGSWRQQVSACTMKDCELFDVRPVGSKNGTTYLTKELLSHWQIDPEELDDRARAILK